MILGSNIWLFPENVVSLHSFMEIQSPPCLTAYNQDNKMNRIKILLATLLTTFLCVSQVLAAEIPAKFIDQQQGDNKWVTIKTANGYYLHAIEEEGKIKLGHTTIAPTTSNYAEYSWKIEGTATDGYTFRCLKYENDPTGKKYISNPSTIQVNSEEVLLTHNADRYIFTDNKQLQLKNNSGYYLAYYSYRYHTMRLHNSSNYAGSSMLFTLAGEWSVSAIIYGSEIMDDSGILHGVTIPSGGIVRNSQTILHSGTFEGTTDQYAISQSNVNGYINKGIKIDENAKTVVSYYIHSNTDYTVKNAPTSGTISGENNTIWRILPENHIIGSGTHTTIPAETPWQMELKVKVTNSNVSFNEWGSTILASTADPFDKWYNNGFQIYQHKVGTLNFKSSSNNNFIIAKSTKFVPTSGNTYYKVIVRYDGSYTYTLRTVLLDVFGSETGEVFNDAWVASRKQSTISEFSCALPAGINITDFKITLLGHYGLLPNCDYAIQNNSSKMYLSWDYNSKVMGSYWAASDASKCQVEFTGSSVTYNGSEYKSFYIMTEVWHETNAQEHTGGIEVLYVGSDNKVVTNANDKKAFIYVEGKIIPVDNLTAPWTINTSDNLWTFDLFANFRILINGNQDGKILYKTTEYASDQYCSFPANAQNIQYSNKSLKGYTASISKDVVYLRADYEALTTGFYDFTDHRYSTNESGIYYWNGSKLYGYSGSKKGNEIDWGVHGDAHQFTVTQIGELPITLHQSSKQGDSDQKYYCTIYVPVPLTLSNGVKAYIVSSVNNNIFSLTEIGESDHILPASTPAILVCENNISNIVISSETGTSAVGNVLKGYIADTPKPSSGITYILSSTTTNGIGFYQYGGTNIPAFKAYYNAEAGNAKPYTFSFDNTTGITDISRQGAVTADGYYYDITGRRVNNPVRGHIYIHNGNKIMF